MIRMMLRPRWVLALLAALAIAAGFALLGQWQLERAVEQGRVVDRATETAVPFAGIAAPDGFTTQTATGQRVQVTGRFVPGDTVLVEGRLNGGVAGVWVVAHLEVTGGAAVGGLPVALGWAPDEASAGDALADFEASIDPEAEVGFEGRFLPSEAPTLPEAGEDPTRMQTVAVAQLVNLWADFDDRPAYFAYVTAAEAPAGLAVIDSPAPAEEFELNWLNIFYAVEWAAFAGFAVFLWYRLVKDAVERERDEQAEADARSEAPAPSAAP